MDIDRIKLNFRLRSGRLKRSKKSVQDQSQFTNEGEALSEADKQRALLNGEQEHFPEVPPKDLPGDNLSLPIHPTPRLEPLNHPVTWSHIPSSRLAPRNRGAGSERSQDIEGSYARLTERSTQKMTRTESREESSSGEEKDYNLHPPPPNKPPHTIDGISELLFSQQHLEFIIHDSILFARFAAFLNRYRPHIAPVLVQYLEAQKAIKAIEYANAVASNTSALPRDDSVIPRAAAILDPRFSQRCQKAVEMLVIEALPAQITYNFVKTVTDVMVKDITGTTQIPVMQGLIEGLTEVFCLTDPSQKDNPIIYASDHFYRMTGYGRDFVIGRNCRFLQGPRTRQTSVMRIKQAIDQGQEVSETFLNYRRDGTPFINLLMIAPLHDDKGTVRYFLGAQVDVTGLVENGRGLEGFDRFLQYEGGHGAGGPVENDKTRKRRNTDKRDALGKLRELSEMFDLEESAIVQSHSRSNSMTRDDDSSVGSVHNHKRHAHQTRRNLVESVIIDSDEIDEKERASWTLSSSSLSGRLPGVYQNYLLLRPSSSLRIIFVSPSLRKMGNLLQTPFLSHISASASVLSGLKDSFASGAPVTAKISWNPISNARSNKRVQHSVAAGDLNGNALEYNASVKPYWISATPLLGSDDQVGIWMVILVEKPNAGASISPMFTSRPPMTPDRVSPPPSRKRRGESKMTNHSQDAAASSESNSDEFVRRAVPVSMTKPERVMIDGSPRNSEHSPVEMRHSLDKEISHSDHGRRSYDSGSRQINGKAFPLPRSRASRRPSSVAEQSEGEISRRSTPNMTSKKYQNGRGPDSPTTGSSEQERLRISDPSGSERISSSVG